MSLVVAVSGGFDPVHVGHIRMIRDASNYGPVAVILNSDAWLTRKKGFCFMPWDQRQEILLALRYVHVVFPVDDSDDTVCEALRRYAPNYFANGGDRTNKNTPELELCAELGIIPIFGIGGDKVESSSDLVRRASNYGTKDPKANRTGKAGKG